MQNLIAFILIIALVVILSALFIMFGWYLFVSPVFGLPGLSITEAIGFSILANAFNGSIVKYNGKRK